MDQDNSQSWSVGCSDVRQKLECRGEGDHGVRVPKMVRGKCALHEKRVRVQFFSLGGGLITVIVVHDVRD
jgi:hypothetical protein